MKFGYKMIKGKYYINALHQSVILKSYEDYIAGTSLRCKADELTKLGIEYAPGKSIWNKNRVRRMLSDENYLGNDIYPQIINKESFDKVQEIIFSRNTQKNCNRQEIFTSSIIPIKCGICNCSTHRVVSHSQKWNIIHICDNPNCKQIYHIDDCQLRNMIKDGLSLTTQNESKPLQDFTLKIYKLNQEIDRDLHTIIIDPEELKNRIFQSAALEYCLCAEKKKSMDYSNIDPCSPVFIREIKKNIEAVYLHNDENIRLQMRGGNIHEYANYSN